MSLPLLAIFLLYLMQETTHGLEASAVDGVVNDLCVDKSNVSFIFTVSNVY